MKNILVIKGADFYKNSVERVEFVSDDVVSIAFKQDGTTTLTAGAEYIYYTIDGTNPTINSTLYTGAFKVTDGTEVKALSVDSNGKKSQVFTAKFEGATYDDDGYVRKGMVLHLDGSDFDGTQWADRISSIPFVVGGGTPTLSENGVYFNGASSMYSDSTINVSSNTGTIEVVLKADKATGYQTVFLQGSLNTIAYIINPNNVSYTIDSTGHKTKLIGDITKLYTHSISDTDNYFNGSLLGDGANERWQNAASKGMIIGVAWTSKSNTYFYTGYIYQIRVYDRVLTPDEVRHNASVDIEKYEISQ